MLKVHLLNNKNGKYLFIVGIRAKLIKILDELVLIFNIILKNLFKNKAIVQISKNKVNN